MAKEEDNTPDDEEDIPKVEDRKRDYSNLKSIQEQLPDLYDAVKKAFEDKKDQDDTINECWDIYNCQLNEHQSYYGTSQVYVPVVHDAIEARETRFINMLFPKSGRYCEITTDDGTQPYDLIALMEYYVRTTSLRTAVVPPLIRGGDVSGQYSLYLSWKKSKRHVLNKKKVAELQHEDGKPVAGSPEYDDVETEEVEDGFPDVMVLDNRNLVMLPVSCTGPQDAETVAVLLRYTKAELMELIADGTLEKEPTETLIENMGNAIKPRTDSERKTADAMGISYDSKGNKKAAVYQVWSKLKVKGEYRRMVTHFAAEDLCLGCKRNPHWSDRVPVISKPLQPQSGSCWGPSMVAPVAGVQYAANDAVNMGFDSAQYSLLPIVLTDPAKNPRTGSMVLNMAAIWETSPKDTQFVNMPQLWESAFRAVAICKEQVMQTLGVNPAMMPQGNAGKKPTQAQVMQEQQVALESVNDPVSILGIVLGELLQWFYELDYQYRTREVTVHRFGPVGMLADMQQVPVSEVRQRLNFEWYGAESFRTAQDMQQMISWANVLRGTPPQMLNGRKLDLGPVLEYVSEHVFGPRIAPKVLINQQHLTSVDAQTENELMENGFPVQVHPGDNDPEHLRIHLDDFKMRGGDMGDPLQLRRGHILMHIQQMKDKAAAAAQQQAQPPGSPGAPGAPRPGAQAQMPTGPQQPAGAIHPDNMQDAGKAPR